MDQGSDTQQFNQLIQFLDPQLKEALLALHAAQKEALQAAAELKAKMNAEANQIQK